MPPPYSAGSVFMQVVPSFAGVQEEIEKHAERYGKAFGEKFDKGFADGTKGGMSKAIEDAAKEAEKQAGKAGKAAGRAYGKGLGDEAGKGLDDAIERNSGKRERAAQTAGKREGEKYGGKFAESIKRALAGAAREVDAIKVDADSDPALAKIAEVQAAVKGLQGTKIGVDIDAADAVAAVAALEATLDAVQRDAAEIDVRVNAAQAMASLATIRTMIERLNELSVTPNVKADRQLGSFEQLLQSKIKAALRDLPPVDLSVDDSEVNQKIAAVRAELLSLAGKEIDIDISTDQALARLRVLLTQLAELDNESADVRVRVDAGAAYRELTAIFGVVAALEANDVDINVDVDNAAANARLAQTGAAARRAGRDGQEGANAFRAFNPVILAALTLGPALVPVLGAIAGGALAVGTAGFAGALGLGVMALGFSGIADGVKALGDVEKNAAKDANAAAKTMKTAANGIRDAERGLERARQSAADAAEDSARRIDDANEARADAEDRLNDAREKAIQSERELVRARQEAQEQIEDLQLRARGGALAERAAALDLAKAQAAYILTFQDGGSTNVEREEAAIALEREKLGYDEAVLANKRLQAQQTDTARTGVEGTETYQQALERVASANEAVDDAQDGVADAVRAVADAQKDAQRSARDSQQAITDALQRQTDAQEDYQQALYDTQVLGSASNQALEDSFARLSPAGRDFALFINSLRDDFKELRDVAQAGMLPGVEDGIRSFLDSSGDDLLTFVGVVSTSIGDLFSRAGDAFGDPEWQRFFALLTEYVPIYIDQFGGIFGNIVEGIRNVMIALFPFTKEFGDGLLGLTQQWADWTAGFDDPDSGFQSFLDWVREIGPSVLEFLGAFVTAFGDLFVALEPLGGLVLTGLTEFFQFISDMDPGTLETVVTGILGLAIAFQLANGAVAAVSAATAIFANPLGIIVFALVALGTALYIAYRNSETFREIVDSVFRAVADTAVWLWDTILKPYLEYAVWIWGVIADALQWAWDNVLQPVLSALGDFVSWLWNDILHPYLSALGDIFAVIMGWIAQAWNEIGRPVFETIWSIVEHMWAIVWPVLQLLGLALQGVWWLLEQAWEYVGKPVFDAVLDVIVWLWEHVFDPVMTWIIGAFGNVMDFFQSAWETVGAPIFELIASVVEALVDVFSGTKTSIEDIWNALLDVLMSPIVFVVETVLNNGLIAGINHIAGIFTDDDTWIDPIPTDWIPGRAFGGPIPGSSPNKRADNIPIWATAGEYMHDVDAVDYYGLNVMDAINARAIPREFFTGGAQYRAYGGLIDPMWGRVHAQFPNARLTSQYRPGDPGYHGRRMAIDIGGSIPYPNATGIREMLQINQWIAQKYGSLTAELIHSGAGGINLYNGQPHRYSADTIAEHFNHVHWAMRSLADIAAGDNGTASFAGAFASTSADVSDPWWQKAMDFVANPFEFLRDMVVDAAGDSLDSEFGQMILNVPIEFARGVKDSLLDLLDFGFGDDAVISGARPIDVPTGPVRDIVQGVAAQRGWDSGPQWQALTALINKESSWNPNAQNPTSTAFGLFQFLNSTWAGTGYAKSSNPSIQAQAGMQYIAQRYGTPNAAWQFHQANNWYADGGFIDGTDHGSGEVHASLYDQGGYLPPGLTMVLNATGKPEPVLTAAELELMRNGGGGGTGGDRPAIGELNLPMMDGPTAEEIVGAIMHAVTVADRGGVHQ